MMVAASTRPVICDAIERRRILTFVYRGRRREVLPVAVGPHVATGEMVLRAYERAGRGRLRMATPWRIFKVAKMQQTVALERGFQEPPPGYTPNDRLLWTAICQL